MISSRKTKTADKKKKNGCVLPFERCTLKWMDSQILKVLLRIEV